MYLSVFYEFCDLRALDIFKIEHPDVKIKISTPMGNPTQLLQTNAKLFYDKENEHKVDEVLISLKKCGFKVTDRNPFFVYKERKTILIPSSEDEYTVCKCGNAVLTPKEPKTRVIISEVKRYPNDRVILEYQQLPYLERLFNNAFIPQSRLIFPGEKHIYGYTGLFFTPEGRLFK